MYKFFIAIGAMLAFFATNIVLVLNGNIWGEIDISRASDIRTFGVLLFVWGLAIKFSNNKLKNE